MILSEPQPFDTRYSDTERRFGGLERLYGASGMRRVASGHVAVAGIGGVGSWCAEALVRSGVGAVTLIDMDHVAESNINRQIHALTETLGQSKVTAMADRLRSINLHCRLTLVDDFVMPDNVADMFSSDVDVIIDCTDLASAKVAMILEARQRHIPIIVCGGAGGKTNGLNLRATDIAFAVNDALLAKLRNTLRRQHGFARATDLHGKRLRRVPKMGVHTLWFDQPATLPSQWGASSEQAGIGLQGLSCAGYGSSVTVTAPMGMAAAGEAIQHILHGRFSV